VFGFRKKAGPTIGLDINSSTISVLQLEKTKTDIKVSRFASTLTPPDIVREGLLSDPEAVGTAVRELIEGVGLLDKGPAPVANIGVPGQSVVIRLMPVPKGMPSDELNDVVKQEAINNLPFPIEEANIDWTRVPGTGRTDPDGVEREDILLGAIQRMIVDGYFRMAEVAGITVGKLEISSLAAVRALTLGGQLGADKGLNLVVNVRQDATDITLVNKSVPLFSRSVLLGVETILESMQRSINATPEEARAFLPKIQLLGVPTVEPRLGQAAQMARSVCGDLTAEVGRSLEFYMSQVGSFRVDQVIISGPGTAIPEIDQFIANRLNLSTTIANPFQGVVYDRAQIVDAMRPHHTTLMGLLVDPDSMPSKTVAVDLNKGDPETGASEELGEEEEIVEEAPTPWFAPALIAGSIIMILVVGAWAYFQYSVIPSKESALADLEQQITENKKNLVKYATTKSVVEGLQRRKQELDAIINHGTPMSIVLKTLKENVPQGVSLGNLKLEGTSATLQGNAASFSKVADFAINLQGSNVFPRAEVASIKRHYPIPSVILYQIEGTLAPEINAESISPADVDTKSVPTATETASAATARVLNFCSAQSPSSQRMKPLMAEAEQKYSGQFQFQLIDVGDPANASLVKKYDVKSAPVVVFLDAAGKVTDVVQGFDDRGERLFAACDKLGKIASKSAIK
jgi:type IV pilus assembly protein PilM